MIGIVGDLHLKENLGYDNYIEGGRDLEEKEILDHIVKSFEDCDKIVFMGDQLNGRTNSSSVIKKFVNFVERFDGKEIYMISGNHEKMGSGRTAIDFLAEIRNPKWHIITRTPITIDNMVFLPFMTNPELEAKDNEDALKKIMKLTKDAKDKTSKILFHHHSMSNTVVNSGRSVNEFPEPILDVDELKKDFDLIVGGHIHRPQIKDNILVSGSIFNHEVGEVGKCIFKIDEETLKVETIDLPGRKIYKREDPTDADIDAIEKNSIVKVIITKKLSSLKATELKEKLKRFDAYIYIEQIPREKKKLHYNEGESLLEFSIPELLNVYAKDNNLDSKKVLKGFDLIKE